MTRTLDTYDKLLGGIAIAITLAAGGMAVSSFALTAPAAIAAILLTGVALFGTGVGRQSVEGNAAVVEK